jgi:hypothetical protein
MHIDLTAVEKVFNYLLCLSRIVSELDQVTGQRILLQKFQLPKVM